MLILLLAGLNLAFAGDGASASESDESATEEDAASFPSFRPELAPSETEESDDNLGGPGYRPELAPSETEESDDNLGGPGYRPEISPSETEESDDNLGGPGYRPDIAPSEMIGNESTSPSPYHRPDLGPSDLREDAALQGDEGGLTIEPTHRPEIAPALFEQYNLDGYVPPPAVPEWSDIPPGALSVLDPEAALPEAEIIDPLLMGGAGGSAPRKMPPSTVPLANASLRVGAGFPDLLLLAANIYQPFAAEAGVSSFILGGSYFIRAGYTFPLPIERRDQRTLHTLLIPMVGYREFGVFQRHVTSGHTRALTATLGYEFYTVRDDHLLISTRLNPGITIAHDVGRAGWYPLPEFTLSLGFLYR